MRTEVPASRVIYVYDPDFPGQYERGRLAASIGRARRSRWQANARWKKTPSPSHCRALNSTVYWRRERRPRNENYDALGGAAVRPFRANLSKTASFLMRIGVQSLHGRTDPILVNFVTIPHFDDPRAPVLDPPHQRFFAFGFLGAVFSAIAAEHKSDTVRQEWQKWFDSLTPGAQRRYRAASSYKIFRCGELLRECVGIGVVERWLFRDGYRWDQRARDWPKFRAALRELKRVKRTFKRMKRSLLPRLGKEAE